MLGVIAMDTLWTRTDHLRDCARTVAQSTAKNTGLYGGVYKSGNSKGWQKPKWYLQTPISIKHVF